MLLAAVVLAVIVAGCGAGKRHSASTSSAPPSTATTATDAAATPTASSCARFPRSHPFVMAPSDSLVQMKEEPPSMSWQSVFVRRNGTGIVTTLVGEVVGANQIPFTLTGAQLATLRQLIAASRSARHPSPAVGHSGYIYFLSLLGRPSVSFDGISPTRFGALARFLDELMYIHC